MAERPVLSVNGVRLEATPSGALYWREEETLVVADLHFEKGSAFARRGVLLPPYDTRTTLKRLSAVIHQYQPQRVISLGDAFHDRAAEARMDEADAALLETMMKGRDWIWVLGNHDPIPPKRFAGEVVAAKRIGRLVLRHEPTEGPSPGELAGHLHPCARVVCDGRTLRRRCFASDGERMVLPAFGAYAGGLNVLDEAFAPLFGPVTAWVIGRSAVYPVGEARLAPDPAPAARISKAC
ncbi:MAG: ligase-associated DNA damage response endonuclease PdeM [Amphiplicatus sp.]